MTPVTMRSLPPVTVTEVASTGSDASEFDPRSELAAALAATGTEYRFETTVTVDDTVTRLVIGAVSGLARRATVTSDGSVLEYVLTEEGEWVRTPEHQWIAAGDRMTDNAPLDGLDLPAAVGVNEGAGDGVVLRAVYPGDAVGAPDLEEVEVRVTIRDGVVRRVRYEVPAGDSTAEVVTVISGVGDVGAISGPGD